MFDKIFEKLINKLGFFGFWLVMFFPLVILFGSIACAILRPFTKGKTKVDKGISKAFAWLLDTK